MTITNQRLQLAAALLAFFLGWLGAHWYYLGETRQANTYLIVFLVSLVLTAAFIGYVGLFGLGVLCIYDFIVLLSMKPADFDARYNAP